MRAAYDAASRPETALEALRAELHAAFGAASEPAGELARCPLAPSLSRSGARSALADAQRWFDAERATANRLADAAATSAAARVDASAPAGDASAGDAPAGDDRAGTALGQWTAAADARLTAARAIIAPVLSLGRAQLEAINATRAPRAFLLGGDADGLLDAAGKKKVYAICDAHDTWIGGDPRTGGLTTLEGGANAVRARVRALEGRLAPLRAKVSAGKRLRAAVAGLRAAADGAGGGPARAALTAASAVLSSLPAGAPDAVTAAAESAEAALAAASAAAEKAAAEARRREEAERARRPSAGAAVLGLRLRKQGAGLHQVRALLCRGAGEARKVLLRLELQRAGQMRQVRRVARAVSREPLQQLRVWEQGGELRQVREVGARAGEAVSRVTMKRIMGADGTREKLDA